MPYQVLARKWRPNSFDTLVGQEHATRALINALEQQRLHHAYLFTGTRGVGKTTIARIIAKCLNCETGITAAPCNQCDTCSAIDQGRFIDLIEVDAASRTKVEDTRELLDNVQYAPTEGRYKVYLIDEVHMLSGHSFNALLKTLEEPPEHVKFLLATTDPQKLPVTVLSRCLQFHLKNLAPNLIAKQLQHILTQEKIESEQDALNEIARAANGSMRDALSLLDQAIAFSKSNIKLNDIQKMLGSIEHSQLYDLLNAISDQNSEESLNCIKQLAEYGADFDNVLETFLTLLHKIAIAQTIKIKDDLTNKFAEKISPEDLQLYYQIALNSRRDLPLAPTEKIGFEMTVMRMLAFVPLDTPVTPTKKSAPQKKPSTDDSNWQQLLEKLPLTGATRAFAHHCKLTSLDKQHAHLLLDPKQAPLLTNKQKERIAKAFSDYFGLTMQVTIDIGGEKLATPHQQSTAKAQQRQTSAQSQINQDPGVQSLMQRFDAKIVPNSVKATDES